MANGIERGLLTQEQNREFLGSRSQRSVGAAGRTRHRWSLGTCYGKVVMFWVLQFPGLYAVTNE